MEFAINGSLKANVPKRNLAASSIIRLRKENVAARGKHVYYRRDASPAIRIISSAIQRNRWLSNRTSLSGATNRPSCFECKQESVTDIRHVFTGIFLNASTTRKAVATRARSVCSIIPKRKTKAKTREKDRKDQGQQGPNIEERRS